MKIIALQAELVWEDVSSNIRQFDQIISTIEDEVDLILLPEMFTSGFTMNPDTSFSTMDGPQINQMKIWSNNLGANVLGSLIIKENDQYFNRLISVFPNGEIQHYDKRHLFAFAGEAESYQCGTERLVYSYKGFKICPLICYDLRFPVWSRNTEDIDLLIYTANWPETRVEHWKALLKARAIENQCYVLACNRVGTDSNGLNYSGHSSLIDFEGNVIRSLEDVRGIVGGEIDTESLHNYRNKLPFLKEKDQFSIH